MNWPTPHRWSSFNDDELRLLLQSLRAVEADASLPSEESRTACRLRVDLCMELGLRNAK